MGAAGILLKNTCPGRYSCGSDGAYWSDAVLPVEIGQTIDITFYESVDGPGYEGECKYRNFNGRATRCSADRGGVVYIVNSQMSGGGDTVCGMD